MDAQVLIKARKVFVQDTIVEHSETCPHCASKGLDNKLRFYYISLEEAIYKCASPTCLYPFERFIFKSLSDKSVYYYEEVIDSGVREAYLRIPLDGQKIYESKNPLSTKLFCDSQRNPDIESYECDFSDLFDDFDIESSSEPVNPPATNSSDVNLDFLEFLDDTAQNATDLNTDKLLDQNGIDNFINDILIESPAKSNTPASPIKTETKVKLEAKLSKSIQHIEKVKGTKRQKKREKPPEKTFTMAIKMARKDLSKSKAVTSTVTSIVKNEPETSAKKIPNEDLKPKLTPKLIPMKKLKTALKSTNNIRPTALAKNLISMDLSKIDSNFLRQYMKAKEDKLFENEANCSNSLGNVKCEKQRMGIANRPPTENIKTLVNNETESVPVLENNIEKPRIATQKESSKKSIEKEHTNAVEKVGKPRTSKPKSNRKDSKVIDVKTEPVDKSSASSSQVKHEPSISHRTEIKTKDMKPKTKSASRKKDIDSKSKNEESKNLKEKVPEKTALKRNRTKNTVKSVDATSTEVKDEKISTKRSRKTKTNDESGKTENEKTKSKRRRTNKRTTSSIEPEITSMPSLFANETESESKPEGGPIAAFQENAKLISDAKNVKNSSKAQEYHVVIESRTSSFEGSEGSIEPLLGFSQADQDEAKVKRRLIFIELPSDDAVSDMTTDVTVLAEKSRLAEINAKVVNVEIENESSENCSSKRPRNITEKSKEKNQPTQESRKDSSTKSNSQTDHHQVDQMPSSYIVSANNGQLNLIDAKSSPQVEAKMDDTIIKEEPVDDSLTPTDVVASCSIAPILAEKRKSVNATHSYYRRKHFKQSKETVFDVKELVEEWDDSECETSDNPTKASKRATHSQSLDKSDIDDALSVITIASETSDSI